MDVGVKVMRGEGGGVVSEDGASGKGSHHLDLTRENAKMRTHKITRDASLHPNKWHSRRIRNSSIAFCHLCRSGIPLLRSHGRPKYSNWNATRQCEYTVWALSRGISILSSKGSCLLLSLEGYFDETGNILSKGKNCPIAADGRIAE